MTNQCKIFISSAYEEDLRPFRSNLAEELRNSGHVPLLFEENFGYWGNDTIQKCIEKVIEADMMILIISHEKGSFTKEDPNVTATYVEYYTALKEGKLIIPFVKSDIAELYRGHIKHIIKKKKEEFIQNKGYDPVYTYDIMQEVTTYIQNHQEQIKKSYQKTDEYVWAFLYDVDQQSTWMYPLELAETTDAIKSIKEYLSEFVKLGVKYIPLEEEIIQNAENAKMFSDYVDFAEDTLEAIRSGVLDANLLLSKMVGKFEGGKVYNSNSPYVKQELGLVEDCSGITLYKNMKDKMVLVAYGGATSPEKEYNLDDSNSFVVDTFNQDPKNEVLYYQESKNQLYMTRKIGSYVICSHYKLNGEWNEVKVKVYENQLFSVIMEVKSRLFYSLLFKMIGGLEGE
ncbi:MAG TPA: DUF4062 domain-containing protein [Bacillus sp. (in: firmicutes)]|nr:DUF4062 domain-containing protein [Bacillus sp. (in: firmicutes)]